MNALCFSMPSLSEMNDLINFCKFMATAPFYQKMGAGGIMAVYLTAKEKNLPFMDCLNGGLYTFDGKVTYSALMVNALIIKAGHNADLLYLDSKTCTIKFTRGDRKNDPDYNPLILEYTIEDARIAGYLSKNNWKTSPKNMLYARCLTGGARMHTPEVLVGVLVAGELVGDDSDSNIQPVLPPEILNKIDQKNEDLIEIKKEDSNIQNITIIDKSPGYDEFILKHEISGDKLEWIEKIAKETKKTLIQTINGAMINEDRFIKAYNNYINQKNK